MAITDILTRIDQDAAAEAERLVAAARAEAARLRAEAKATTEREREHLLAEAERAAREDAATILANARLAARDALLGAKRELAERVLADVRASLEALPDGAYLTLIAEHAASAATKGARLSLASSDARRLSGLADSLAERGVAVSLREAAAPIERGALLEGDRVRIEISPAALVADRRDELLLIAARTLFGEGA